MNAKSKSTDLATIEPADSTKLMAIIEKMASDPQFDVAKLERMLAVKLSWEADEARKAFNVAMDEFQAACPPIPKTGKAKVRMKSGGQYEYDFPKFEVMQKICNPHLLAVELHTSFGKFEVLPNGWIQIHCIVSHRLGHSESTAVAVPVPKGVSVNESQQAGIALSYAKRYAYAAVLGLVIEGVDNDAGVPPGYGGRGDDGAVISDKQAIKISEYLEELEADTRRFCAFFGVDQVADIPAARFDEAMQMLKDKERGTGAFKK